MMHTQNSRGNGAHFDPNEASDPLNKTCQLYFPLGGNARDRSGMFKNGGQRRIWISLDFGGPLVFGYSKYTNSFFFDHSGKNAWVRTNEEFMAKNISDYVYRNTLLKITIPRCPFLLLESEEGNCFDCRLDDEESTFETFRWKQWWESTYSIDPLYNRKTLILYLLKIGWAGYNEEHDDDLKEYMDLVPYVGDTTWEGPDEEWEAI
jgi:hypothetical protein